jgi:N,N'-diacetyllegionaminate synthase
MKSMQPVSRTLIIAEVGVNHNGDLKIAKELIKEAAIAGADAVKFQSFNTDSLVTEHAPKAEYQITSDEDNDSNYQMLKKLELSRDDHAILINECKIHNIEFFSTAFDIENLEFLLQLNMNRIKIPSGEITNLPFLKYISSINMPVILSTGMADLNEIEGAVDILLCNKLSKSNLSILHCTSQYPAPFDEVNLRAIPTLKSKFGIEVGYSDHTLGIEASIAAVALGATIIEKHITLDSNLPGPDHKASIEPNSLRDMISAIRNIEIGLGDGIKQPSLSEIKMRNVARKSIVAKKHILKDDILSMENMTIKRPGNGISPMLIEELFGKKASKDFVKDEIIIK